MLVVAEHGPEPAQVRGEPLDGYALLRLERPDALAMFGVGGPLLPPAPMLASQRPASRSHTSTQQIGTSTMMDTATPPSTTWYTSTMKEP